MLTGPHLPLVYPRTAWFQRIPGGSQGPRAFPATWCQTLLAPRDKEERWKAHNASLPFGHLLVPSLTLTLTPSLSTHSPRTSVLRPHRSWRRAQGSGSGTHLGTASSHPRSVPLPASAWMKGPWAHKRPTHPPCSASHPTHLSKVLAPTIYPFF